MAKSMTPSKRRECRKKAEEMQKARKDIRLGLNKKVSKKNKKR